MKLFTQLANTFERDNALPKRHIGTASLHRHRLHRLKGLAKNGQRDAPGKRVGLMGIRNDCVCRRDG